MAPGVDLNRGLRPDGGCACAVSVFVLWECACARGSFHRLSLQEVMQSMREPECFSIMFTY